MSLKSTTTSVWACVVATVTSSAVAYPRSHRRRYTHFTNAVTAAPCTSFSSTLSNVSVLSQHNGRLGFAFPPVSLRCTMRRTCLSSFIQPSPSTRHRQRATQPKNGGNKMVVTTILFPPSNVHVFDALVRKIASSKSRQTPAVHEAK